MPKPENSGAKILTEQRRSIIADLVGEQGSVTAEDLGSRFGVSHMTIYRDLKVLEGLGKLRFVRGGAIRDESETINEPLYFAKRKVHKKQKELIAAYAAKHFISDGDFVILEAGTTVSAMVKHLKHKHLTVMTNGLETVNEATALLPDLTVMCCGGILRDVSHTFVGPQAEQFFRELRGKTLFLGASGLTLEGGITDPNQLEIQVKRAMIASVDCVVLLLDSSKFGQHSLSLLLPFNQVHILVTDANAPAADLASLRALGVDVRIAR
jgi:DeoR/GlpR family transcriptional regulator of sugar metabolism